MPLRKQLTRGAIESDRKCYRDAAARHVALRSLILTVMLLPAGGCSDRTAVSPKSEQVEDVKQAHSLDRSAGYSKSEVRFRDVATEVRLGLSLPQQPRPMRTLESFGCGCASFDYDNDGWQDILVVSDPRPVLFRNLQNGKFSDVSLGTGMTTLPEGKWTGCAIGDFSGDGWLDLPLTGYHCLCLCQNNHGVDFQDVTADAGLSPTNDHHWGAGAGFMDLDGDLWLDLVVLNYVHFDEKTQQYCVNGKGVQTSCPPKVYEPEYGVIYRNKGGNSFEAVPAENAMRSTQGIGLVIEFSDLDSNGQSDLCIGNDARNADLLMNEGQMKFRNEGLASGLAMSRRSEPPAAMGVDWGDFDRDGRLDLAVSDFQDKGALLYRNPGNTVFADVSESAGFTCETARYLGFGLNWIDFENDDWLDIALLHGHVYENIADWRPDISYRQPIVLMHNVGERTFEKIITAPNESISRPIVGRGSGSIDFDNDGDLDMLSVDYEGRFMLLQNETRSSHHWLTHKLLGRSPNVFGYGAKVHLQSGDKQWVAQVSPASSYLSSKDPRVHFGLSSVSRLDRIEVVWPSGVALVLKDVQANQILEVTEPEMMN
jgi:hypothetical protein